MRRIGRGSRIWRGRRSWRPGCPGGGRWARRASWEGRRSRERGTGRKGRARGKGFGGRRRGLRTGQLRQDRARPQRAQHRGQDQLDADDAQRRDAQASAEPGGVFGGEALQERSQRLHAPSVRQGASHEASRGQEKSVTWPTKKRLFWSKECLVSGGASRGGSGGSRRSVVVRVAPGGTGRRRVAGRHFCQVEAVLATI